jgi:hypothetical protein
MEQATDTTIPVNTGGVAEPGATAPAAAPNLSDFVLPDGSFKEGWRDHVVPHDLRGRLVFDGLKDLPGAMKQLAHLEGLIGKQGKGVIRPGEKATPSEWDAYWEALGRPKTADDYKVEVPKGLEQYYDDPMMKEARSELHKAGLTQQQVEVVMALDAKRLASGDSMLAKMKEDEAKAAQEVEVKEKEEINKSFRDKWGADYDQRLLLANRMVNDFTQPGADRDAVLARIGNDPIVANYLSEIASHFIGAGAMQPDEQTVQNLEGDITKLRETPGYLQGTLSKEETRRITESLEMLYKKAYPGKKK